ncbi:hypothetical protein ABZ593_33980, partial [Streptomyces sp. NPDC012617]|uniref:preprotein translocase subunit SecA n=1 Tax=Streptomyces sp. NPDC012617 TaxID=3156677 RepID=UPI00340F5819
AKFAAVVDDIAEKHEKGQPILVGTTSVAKFFDRTPAAPPEPGPTPLPQPSSGPGEHREVLDQQ